MSDDLFYWISSEAKHLAELANEPVEIRRTQEGWRILDHDRLKAKAEKELSLMEKAEMLDSEEAALNDDPEYRRAVTPDSGLAPDPDGDYTSANWAKSEEDGWFYDD